MTLYEVLGVDKLATDEEIKAAYRTWARAVHPDKNRNNPKAAEKMKEVNVAYEVLSDKELRRAYDDSLKRFSLGAMREIVERFAHDSFDVAANTTRKKVETLLKKAHLSGPRADRILDELQAGGRESAVQRLGEILKKIS